MDLSEVPIDPSARHPWELARFRFFADLLHRFSALSDARRVLDAGAGDAWFSRTLLLECHPDTRFTCWDEAYTADSAERLGTAQTGRIELSTTPPAGRVDVLLALDVLEHVERDDAFLTTVVRENLRAGGTALVSVPAWQVLATRHDERLNHHRRYTPTMLKQIVSVAGLTTLEMGGAFHSLMLPRAASRALEQFIPQRNSGCGPPLAWTAGPVVTRLVYRALRVDNWVSSMAARASISLPGLSLWAICRKP